MRFKGTLILLILCAGLGAFLYFYEFKGAEERTKAKQEENVVWKVPSADVSQLDLITPDQHITATRNGDQRWRITAPRSLDADTDELNRLANSAAEISRERVVEENAANLAQFGLDPAQITIAVKTKDGKVHEIRFGQSSPNGESNYAALKGQNQVFLVSSYVASGFNKKLDDLRSRVILGFEQFETQSLDLKSAKGTVALAKETDRWWIQGKDRWTADSSAVNALLGDIANGRLKEFFDENPDDYANLGLDKPLVDVRLIVGKDRAIKHLMIGQEKSKLVRKGQSKAKPAEKKAEEKTAAGTGTELYLARDESRAEMFFVDKEFVDKLLKTPGDLRDKTLAFFQRTDIDAVAVTNAKGAVSIAKAQAGGDWLVGEGKKKAKWDAVNDIFDALEKPVKGFVDAPGALSNYGLDKPVAHVVLKQGAQVRVDCIFGKEAKDGVYAQVQGEPYIKIVEKEILEKLRKSEADYLEPLPPPPAPPAPPAPKK
jgi:hypothetical protein